MPWHKLLDQKLSGGWMLRWPDIMTALHGCWVRADMTMHKEQQHFQMRRMVTTWLQGFEESLQHPIRPQSSEHGFRVQCLPYMDSSELWIFRVRKVLSSDTSVASILKHLWFITNVLTAWLNSLIGSDLRTSYSWMGWSTTSLAGKHGRSEDQK